MAENNKMKDMPVNKLMIQMAFPITELVACLVGYVFLKKMEQKIL